ncbi:hypothetical protein [Falsigemmobacter faecalis]|uniref:Uncharacterized protein n=1 Tax=Falsigemmobacter faecalis TaxID=2488730 RepID=A0A3P3D6P4_9RHOB|nr:hypothetical protein [Falsigemmobacter faecalis]RRH70027.1 hypothetical protein EG244_17610 [Falsigemmobacter faecalis]
MAAPAFSPAATTERKPMSRASEIRGIDQTLTLADNGQYLPTLLQENDELISDIVDFSQAYGTKAKGKLVIAIEYTTDRYGQIDISVEHKITKPKAPKAKAVAWTAAGGGLSSANPNQRAMEIREVSNGRRELRSPTID